MLKLPTVKVFFFSFLIVKLAGSFYSEKKKSREKLLKSLSLSRRCNLIGVSVRAIWITVLSTGWVWFAHTAARKQYVKRGSFAPFNCSTFRTKQDNDRHGAFVNIYKYIKYLIHIWCDCSYVSCLNHGMSCLTHKCFQDLHVTACEACLWRTKYLCVSWCGQL